MKKVDFNATIYDFFNSVDWLLYKRSCLAMNDKQFDEINKNRSRLWAVVSNHFVREEDAVCGDNNATFGFTKYGFLPYIDRGGCRFVNEMATEQYDVFINMIKILSKYCAKVKTGVRPKSEECEILHLYRCWKYLCGKKNIIRNLMYSIPSDAFFAKKVKSSKTR